MFSGLFVLENMRNCGVSVTSIAVPYRNVTSHRYEYTAVEQCDKK